MTQFAGTIAASVAIALALFFPGCADQGAGEGEFCERDSDCASGLVCRENICVDEPIDECDPPCNPLAEVCRSGLCVPVGDPNDKDGDGSLAVDDCNDFDREVHPGAHEYCDGQDNDCDTATDEDCPACTDGQIQDCGTDVGECTRGVQTCQNGLWEACNGITPTPELCDQKDNDCDGQIDEVCPCRFGDELPCGTDVGECVQGVQLCENGAWSGCRNGQLPVPETCDRNDNDCDGYTDDGFAIGTPCDGTGECGTGTVECAGPTTVRCSTEPGGSADQSGAELCDGKDNDCDGQTDEDCPCSAGEQEPCGTDVGECTRGTRTCRLDGTWGDCSGRGPTEEICDGKDNDCDGTTDNPATPQPCEKTQGVCADAVRTGCNSCDYGPDYQATEAACDGKDNDCDGLTDEELPPDSHEPNESCGLGVLEDLDEAQNTDEYMVVEGTLDRWSQGAPADDNDWYQLTLVEANHWTDCILHQYQCFDFVLRLELPAGENHADWEMCILDGKNGSCADFGNPTYTFCTDEADWEEVSQSYHITLRWDGECGVGDGGDFYILIRNAGQVVANCNPYRLYLQFWYLGPDLCP